MSIIILAFLIFALGLGAYLLIPSTQKRALVSRSTVATAHGILGGLGLAGSMYVLFKTKQDVSMLVVTATGLAFIGFLFGIGNFLMRHFTQSKPDLVLISHVIFAGMGAAVIVVMLLY